MADQPAEILARVREVYATCRTYQDVGAVVERFCSLDGKQRHTTRQPFSTAFLRPDRFRFEYSDADVGPEDEWERMIVLWNEQGVRSTWTIEPGIRHHDSVHDAIGGAKGVSGGSSYTVPALLLGSGEWRPLSAVEQVSSCERRVLAGLECFVLQSRPREGESHTLWVGCRDFLIRRIDEEQVFDERLRAELFAEAPPDRREELERSARPFRTESTTNYEPRLDAPIEPEHFDEPKSWSSPGPSSATYLPRRSVVRSVSAGSGLPDVRTILARVRGTYASCRAFRDRGTYTDTRVEQEGAPRKKTDVKQFSLAFQRPGRLRFELVHPTIGPEDEWMRIVWLWNEEGFRSGILGSDRGPHAGTPEEKARFGQTFIPVGLLLGAGGESDPLPSDDSAVLVGLDVLAGGESLVVRGKLPGRGEATLWIGREDHLVRRSEFTFVHDEQELTRARQRLEERLREPLPEEERRVMQAALEIRESPYRSELVLAFDPQLDPEIPPETFATPWRTS